MCLGQGPDGLAEPSPGRHQDRHRLPGGRRRVQRTAHQQSRRAGSSGTDADRGPVDARRHRAGWRAPAPPVRPARLRPAWLRSQHQREVPDHQGQAEQAAEGRRSAGAQPRDPRDGDRRGQAVRRGVRQPTAGPLHQHPADRLGPRLPPPAAGPEQGQELPGAELRRLLLRHLAGRLVRRHLPEPGRPVHPRLQHAVDDEHVRQPDPRLDVLPAASGQDAVPVPGSAQRRLRSRQERQVGEEEVRVDPQEAGHAGEEGPEEGQDPGDGAGGPRLHHGEPDLLRRGLRQRRLRDRRLGGTSSASRRRGSIGARSRSGSSPR